MSVRYMCSKLIDIAEIVFKRIIRNRVYDRNYASNRAKLQENYLLDTYVDLFLP